MKLEITPASCKIRYACEVTKVKQKEITVILIVGNVVVLAVGVTKVVVAMEVAEVVVEEAVGVGGFWGTNDIGGYYTPFFPF